MLTLGMGGRVTDGIAAGRASLASEPDSAELHAALAALLFAAGGAEGLAQLRQAIERGVDPPVLLGTLLALQLELGDEAAARATLAELEREHPRTALAIAQLRLHDDKAPRPSRS